MKIGKTLVALRKKRGITQDQIADILGIKRARYNSWENDIAKPGLEMLDKIADFYGVQTDFILGRNISDSDNQLSDIEEDVRALARDIQDLNSGDKDLLKDLINTMRQRGKKALDE
ncbi:helix-turn-helix domain-containing protein [Priestia megaterium]|uniref:helix-turn-helix domain-containing protein n=1 Tax=Priestia megaterium TaxID=1404 RepID=UPI00387A5A59